MDSDLAWVNGKSGRQSWRYADAFQRSIISEGIYDLDRKFGLSLSLSERLSERLSQKLKSPVVCYLYVKLLNAVMPRQSAVVALSLLWFSLSVRQNSQLLMSFLSRP